ncbi:hypothetical protein [Nocardia sp. NPDC057227]|uniref:hypothetical protein n=1 Tax=Nocardia sp. NPDC057227 TaxID=3346056 RepID=UPI003639A31D
MSGDPVEESGQALRQGFVQALQTAHSTAAMVRSRGGDARSVAAHRQQMRLAETREGRSLIEHGLRVDAAGEAREQAATLAAAKVDEVQARIRRGGEAHRMDQRVNRRGIERADADLARRTRLDDQEYRHREETHTDQRTAHTNREIRLDELHELDQQYKQLLIDIRDRATDLTDTLTATGPDGEAMAATAGFAAADAAADLSEQHAADAAAYRERLIDDTGRDPGDVATAPAPGEPGKQKQGPAARGTATTPAGYVIDVELDPAAIIDAEIVDVERVDADRPPRAASAQRELTAAPVTGAGAAADLAADLSIAAHLAHTAAEASDPAPDTDAGAVISEAIAATGVDNAQLSEVAELGLEAAARAQGPTRVRAPGLDP